MTELKTVPNPTYCPLCQSTDLYVLTCRKVPYVRCRHCQLVHLPKTYQLSSADEKARYDLHNNDPFDPKYRQFLNRSFEQVVQRLSPPATGLDFGCGPGPALMEMAREQGYTIQGYDPFYAPDTTLLSKRYDFVTCTEVAEHLANPLQEMETIWSLLKPNGFIVIQTQRVLSDQRFCEWRYPVDPTHITFFSEISFQWLAQRWQAKLSFPRSDVVVFEMKKNPAL